MSRRKIEIWEWYLACDEIINKEIPEELKLKIINFTEQKSNQNKKKKKKINNLIDKIIKTKEYSDEFKEIKEELEKEMSTLIKTMENCKKYTNKIEDKVWNDFLSRIRKLKFNRKRITITIDREKYNELIELIDFNEDDEISKSHDEIFNILINKIKESNKPTTVVKNKLKRGKVTISRRAPSNKEPRKNS